MVVPLGCMYTPMKKIPGMPAPLPYEPVQCKTCLSALNPYCSVDVRGKLWVCPFCYQRNQFPPHYADISETNLPAELIPQFTTIEYQLVSKPALAPPIYLFVVDTCLDEKNLQALKDSLLMSLSLIPENALVGLITFGTTVQVFELAFAECPKSYVFRGNKDVTAKQIQQLLGLGGAARPQQTPSAQTPSQITPNRFLRPFSEVEFTLETILEELQRDPRPVKNDRRPLRATGAAMSLAVGLLEATFSGTGARIMVFLGGPCTHGPGMVVSDELKEPIRSHHDINKDRAKYVSSATQHYDALAKRAVKAAHTVDIYACSLDQVGLMEMRYLVKRTGGVIILADEFESDMFKKSFQKLFAHGEDEQLKMAFNGTLEVQTSRELKVCGAVGHLSSLGKKSSSVAETEIGIGGTSAWRMCGLDPSATYALYFEVVNQQAGTGGGQQGLVQFTSTHQRANGLRVMRVTTLAHAWAPAGDPKAALTMGFDQEAAAVLMGRVAVFKAETEEAFDVLRWLDRMLIRLVSKFAEYRKDEPSSFRLSSNFTLYPQFMFHLRRSCFLQVFNNSPDESTFYRFMLNRESVTNSLTMIQPTLDAYTFNGPPVPVLLSATSLASGADRILLLDTFFHVVVWRGERIADWVKQGYQADPQHEAFRQLLAAPLADADALLRERFPIPRFVECDQHSSQERFLLATVDPGEAPAAAQFNSGASQESVFTEDVNLHVFMEHLKKLAVQ
ncbi:Protein transport protein sec23, putative [Acanthamoeba castellanii str. Neff]|uniref:Protein transport protein SEC23 n=1 Tax=Acanthamoeba castellanii (strain ATCC 30010 / Neff) TaxID=1257118 RepID=L8H0B4_ACACF|nr:Protein transport protein sec23, putative [Acanthamoeba castellanii str. Neff]ELR18642.1 Protein transport protein sec23, putative [Acanthamoeba castellanii str. Neff]